jgi:hypothetical protein
MSVEPKVFIDYNSRDADSLEIAYSKYNSHYHSETTRLNFYTYDIYPDDIVSMYTSLLVPVFTGECRVDSFTDAGLVLSKTANVTVTDGSATIDGIIYNNVNIGLNSNLLTINQENGVLTPEDSQYVLSNYINGTINYKLNGKVYLSLTKPYNSRLIKFNYYAKPSSISTPSTINLFKVDSSNNITTYFSNLAIVTNAKVTINLPLDDPTYILGVSDLLYIEILNGTDTYSNAINSAFPPLLDYELEEYIIGPEEIDTIAPNAVITLSDYNLIIGDTATVTFTFSEPVLDFTVADVTAPNGTLSNFTVTGNPLIYTATFTPTLGIEDNSNIINIGTNYTDIVGNVGIAANSPNYVIDTVAPSVSITMSDYDLTVGETATVTFTFSEAITGFIVGDVTAPNGTLSDFTVTGNPLVYTATFTPTPDIEDNTNIIVIEQGTYQDTAGNLGLRGESLNYTIDTLLVVLPTVTYYANPITHIGDIGDCIDFPITVYEFTDIKSFEFTITYDSSKWTYVASCYGGGGGSDV